MRDEVRQVSQVTKPVYIGRFDCIFCMTCCRNSRAPVLIRRQNRDVAVIMSAEEYDRIRGAKVAELDQLCERVSQRAAARGLTDEVLANLLKG